MKLVVIITSTWKEILGIVQEVAHIISYYSGFRNYVLKYMSIYFIKTWSLYFLDKYFLLMESLTCSLNIHVSMTLFKMIKCTIKVRLSIIPKIDKE